MNNTDILLSISIMIFIVLASVSLILNYLQIVNQFRIMSDLGHVVSNWENVSALQSYINNNGAANDTHG